MTCSRLPFLVTHGSLDLGKKKVFLQRYSQHVPSTAHSQVPVILQGWLPFFQYCYVLQRVHATPTPRHGRAQKFSGPQKQFGPDPSSKRLKPTPYQTTPSGSGDILKLSHDWYHLSQSYLSIGITTPL